MLPGSPVDSLELTPGVRCAGPLADGLDLVVVVNMRDCVATLTCRAGQSQHHEKGSTHMRAPAQHALFRVQAFTEAQETSTCPPSVTSRVLAKHSIWPPDTPPLQQNGMHL